MIYVCPLRGVPEAAAALRPSRLVSLLGPDYMNLASTPAGLHPERHLRISVNDIVTHMPGQTAPCEAHARTLIDFVDGWEKDAPMLIHCWAGISRSTAAAFIALCRLHGPGEEETFARALRAAAPHAQPNRLLVACADALLGRDGDMVEALDAMGPARQTDIGQLFGLPLSPR